MHFNDEMLPILEHEKLVPSQMKAQDCPFCDDWASILSHRIHQTEGQVSSSIQQADILVSLTHFKRHVATHQEQLAIFAVPRIVDDDEERSHGDKEATSRALSSRDNNSQLTDDELRPTEDSSSDNLCVYLSGLPPAVREDDILNHIVLRGFAGITDLRLMDDFAFIRFQDPDDVHRAVQTLNGSILMGVRIHPQLARFAPDREKSETHVVEKANADISGTLRALDKINAADSHFRTVLLPMCEEFIAEPPADPQKRQDQSTHILTMIRQQVWSTVNFIDARNDNEIMERKAKVLETVDVMLDRIRAVPITNMVNAEAEAKGGKQTSYAAALKSGIPTPEVTLPLQPKPVKAPVVRRDNVPMWNPGSRGLDPPLEVNQAALDHIKKWKDNNKLCHNHYLRGPCARGDLCPFEHRYRPNETERAAIAFLARLTPCSNGQDCESDDCIYGHHVSPVSIYIYY